MAIPPERRRLHFGIAALAGAIIAVNLLNAAAERESVDSPPDLPFLAAGIALALAALPLAILALRGPGPPRVLGWIAIAVLAWCAVVVAWLLSLPATWA